MMRQFRVYMDAIGYDPITVETYAMNTWDAAVTAYLHATTEDVFKPTILNVLEIINGEEEDGGTGKDTEAKPARDGSKRRGSKNVGDGGSQ